MPHNFNLLNNKFPFEFQQHRFYSLYELKRRLEKMGIARDEIEIIAAHERAHYETAKRLGYNPCYGCEVLLKEYSLGPFKIKKPEIRAMVVFKEEIRVEDHIKILSAPENLSLMDKEMLRKLNQKP